MRTTNMTRTRTMHHWSVGLAGGLAFVFAASLGDVVGAMTGGDRSAAAVVSSDQQGPPDGGGRQGGQGRQGGGGGGQAPRPYDQVVTATTQNAPTNEPSA